MAKGCQIPAGHDTGTDTGTDYPALLRPNIKGLVRGHGMVKGCFGLWRCLTEGRDIRTMKSRETALPRDG